MSENTDKVYLTAELTDLIRRYRRGLKLSRHKAGALMRPRSYSAGRWRQLEQGAGTTFPGDVVASACIAVGVTPEALQRIGHQDVVEEMKKIVDLPAPGDDPEQIMERLMSLLPSTGMTDEHITAMLAFVESLLSRSERYADSAARRPDRAVEQIVRGLRKEELGSPDAVPAGGALDLTEVELDHADVAEHGWLLAAFGAVGEDHMLRWEATRHPDTVALFPEDLALDTVVAGDRDVFRLGGDGRHGGKIPRTHTARQPGDSWSRGSLIRAPGHPEVAKLSVLRILARTCRRGTSHPERERFPFGVNAASHLLSKYRLQRSLMGTSVVHVCS